MELGWLETAIVLVMAIAAYVWANVVARRPADPLNPRLIPPLLVMSVSLVVALLMLAHMITLATGTPFRGRAG